MKACNAHIILFSMVLFFFPSAQAVNFQQFIIQLNGISLLIITKRQGAYSQGMSYEIRGVSPANGYFVPYILEPDNSEQASQSVLDQESAFLQGYMAAPEHTSRNHIGDLLPALIYTHHQLKYRSFDVTIDDNGNALLSMEVSSHSHIEAQVTLDSVAPAPWDGFLGSGFTSDRRLLHYLFNYINHSQLSRFINLANEHNNGTAPGSSHLISTYQLSYFLSGIINGHYDDTFSINLNSSNRRFDSSLNVQIHQSGEEALVLNVVGVVNRSGLDREILEPQVPLSVQYWGAMRQ